MTDKSNPYRLTIEAPNGDVRSVLLTQRQYESEHGAYLEEMVDDGQDANESPADELAELKSALSMYLRHPNEAVRRSAKNVLEFAADEWLHIRGITY